MQECLVELRVSVDRQQLLLVAIVAAQAVWLGLIMLRGWYSGPDLGNLASATGRPLNWSYLSSAVGGHLGVPANLFWWLLNRAAPLNWTLTVFLRLVLQGTATVLLYRLLESLVGGRPWIAAVVALYAFSPLLVPGIAVLSSGLGLSLGEVCMLAAFLAYVRYIRHGRLRDAAMTSMLVLVMVMVADITLATILALPLLSIGFLHKGSLPERLAASVKRWLVWLFLAIGGAVYVGLYAAGEYSPRQQAVGFGDAAQIVGRGWVRVLGPALLGGPWRFADAPEVYSSSTDSPLVVQVLGQLALALLTVMAVRRTGWRALLALALPVGVLMATLVLTARGRFAYFGFSLPDVPRYSYYLPVFIAMGVTLAFARDLGAPPLPRSRFAPAGRWGIALVLVASLVTSGQFARGFWRNPARGYVNTLALSARTVGRSADIYDTAVPTKVVPFLAPRHFVSDLLGLSGLSVRFDGSSSQPLVASEDGRLVPAGFVFEADISGPKRKDCGIFVQGATTTTLRFSRVPEGREWFLQLQMYEPHANSAAIQVRDAGGQLLPIASGKASFRSADTLVVAARRLHFGSPATVTLTTTDLRTNFCLVHAYIGVPLPQ